MQNTHNRKNPVLSVIMPVFNAGLHLREAIDSILNQTFTDFEFLIFNDGSVDDSLGIIESYSDDRITLHNSLSNQGYVYHLNYGLQVSKGKYIARMDADDISISTRFEKQISFLEENSQVGVCGTQYKTFGGYERFVKNPSEDSDIRIHLLSNTPIGHPTAMLRKSIIEKNNVFYNQKYVPAEDYEFWYQLSKYTELHNIPESLLLYRTHDKQISASNYMRQQSSANEIRLLIMNEIGFKIKHDEEAAYLLLINNFGAIIKTDELTRIYNIINNLSRQNDLMNIFDKKKFDNFMKSNWFQIYINNITAYSPSHLRLLLFNKYSDVNRRSLIENFKIIYKCLTYHRV